MELSFLLFRGKTYHGAVRSRDVARVLPRYEWSGRDPLLLEALGIATDDKLTPERVVLIAAADVIPLLVRGPLVTLTLPEESLISLPSQFFGQSQFSSAIFQDDVLFAFLLEPQRLAQL